MIAAVVCTGESVTQADVDFLRGKCKVVVVSDAYKMAPWADAMVSHDSKWWRANEDCDFAGPKYCGGHSSLQKYGVQRFLKRGHRWHAGGNSGCLGILVAAEKLGETPERILLLGADNRGTHYFGPHTKAGLHNTSPKGFVEQRKQYEALRHLPVVNCSPISALSCFPKMGLADALA